MSDCNEITSVLTRGGTDQQARDIASLNPGNLKLQGFGIREWMQFAYNFAKDVKFFSTQDDVNANGNWEAFFKNDQELEELLSTYQQGNQLTPHLTLFICFLKLIEISTEHFNGLTKRHLDFYYSEVLQIDKLPEEADKAYVLFELAKNVAAAQLQKGTELDGGKDSEGKKRVYTLKEELVANKAQVAQLKSVYNDPNNQNPLTYPVKAAPAANSFNGKGEKFPGTDTSWRPFGYNHTSAGLPELPDAKLGFAVASPALALAEGTRDVVVQASFLGLTELFSQQALIDNVEVYYSGAKGWVGPLQLSALPVEIAQNNANTAVYQTGMAIQRLTLVTSLDAGMEEVVNYDKAVHGEQLDTQAPVFRFIVKTDTPEGYTIYKNCSKKIERINVRVSVSGVKNLVLGSDTGALNPAKPFYPFTTNAVKGSSFSVYNAEVFSKNWKNIGVNIHWKNTPEDFRQHYFAYDKMFKGNVGKNWVSNLPKIDLFVRGRDRSFYGYDSIVTNDAYFKAKSYIENDGEWQLTSHDLVTLFNEVRHDDGVSFETNFSASNTGYAPQHNGPLRLTLEQSFLQELFPTIYALSVSSQDPLVIIPNQPYTPLAESVTLSYTAEAVLGINTTTQDAFDARSVQLFHEHPFGQSEEHLFLKKQFSPKLNECTLTPSYCKGGELYIGLQNVEHLQQVSLLIQVLEGTENPLADSFIANQGVQWDILCSNFWKPLTSPLMLANQVDNFLKTGIVKFVVPKEATSDNTLLPEGFFWVRAKMFKQYDAVCRVLSINAQAVLAQFDNRGNELSHLEKGIPAGTISKLIERSPLVKTVTQPYNSFGGKPEESDAAYYRRVSERLRHKNRAVTLWDYEKLILQRFPELYKVKCLNHTCDCSFVSAGNVTLVVLPDTVRKNVFDIYQPRVSKALLNEIRNYVDELNSLHVKTEVINPDYEEVKVSLKVKFYDGLDIPLHIEKLNADITGYLSPWTLEKKEDIRFGVTLHRPVLIDYLEKLDYVDYLQDVKLIMNNDDSLKSCTPSSPKAILVSAKKHEISTDIITCTTTTNPSPEICQL